MPVYKVALIVLYDSENRFLLQHRTKDAKFLADHWAFFGGGLKAGETFSDALRREALEELNYKIENPHLVLGRIFQLGQIEAYICVYAEKFTKDKNQLSLNEGQGWGWYSESELGGLKMVKRDRGILDYISKWLKSRS